MGTSMPNSPLQIGASQSLRGLLSLPRLGSAALWLTPGFCGAGNPSPPQPAAERGTAPRWGSTVNYGLDGLLKKPYSKGGRGPGAGTVFNRLTCWGWPNEALPFLECQLVWAGAAVEIGRLGRSRAVAQPAQRLQQVVGDGGH